MLMSRLLAGALLPSAFCLAGLTANGQGRTIDPLVIVISIGFGIGVAAAALLTSAVTFHSLWGSQFSAHWRCYAKHRIILPSHGY
jgi:hypothetical protein